MSEDIDVCPVCGAGHVKVTDSRPTKFGRHRRRSCLACGHRWNTLEIASDERPASMEQARAALRKARAVIDAALAKL